MNTFGNRIKLTVFGQSHAKALGVTIDGLPAGVPIDYDYIEDIMRLRAPGNLDISTKRSEPDKVEFISGVVNGKTVGTSVCAVIQNTDTISKDYSSLVGKPRPSHADYPATVKYGENYDLRGSGQFSGRMTASLCIAGAVALPILEKNGIKIATHILSVSDIRDRSFDDLDDEPEIMDALTKMPFAVIDKEASAKMTERIKQAFKDCDSVGGVIECKITGLPVGLGLPMFDGLENVISRAIFAVPAVKGIEFGAGFSGSTLCGSEYNDRYYYDENGKVRTKTNHAGGICRGMATGMPVIFRAAFKPTPSIAKPQDTVDLVNKQNTVIAIHGRHDPCVVTRANVVVRAVTAFALLDLMAEDGYLSF